MEPEPVWQLFEATGDPMAYVWYKAMGQKEAEDGAEDAPPSGK
ncbi:MAG: hypothetical protein PUC45_09275 [Oscillospiraceae bacterium]|nr:hypothetical protein [Oscillospiraceae bacterium]